MTRSVYDEPHLQHNQTCRDHNPDQFYASSAPAYRCEFCSGACAAFQMPATMFHKFARKRLGYSARRSTPRSVKIYSSKLFYINSASFHAVFFQLQPAEPNNFCCLLKTGSLLLFGKALGYAREGLHFNGWHRQSLVHAHSVLCN